MKGKRRKKRWRREAEKGETGSRDGRKMDHVMRGISIPADEEREREREKAKSQIRRRHNGLSIPPVTFVRGKHSIGHILDGRVPAVDGAALRQLELVDDGDDAAGLVDASLERALDDEAGQDLGGLVDRDVELERGEAETEALVRLDQSQHGPAADVARHLIDVLGDEGIRQQVQVGPQDLLVPVQVVALVHIHEVGHSRDARIVLVPVTAPLVSRRISMPC